MAKVKVVLGGGDPGSGLSVLCVRYARRAYRGEANANPNPKPIGDSGCTQEN